ncbi:HipA domain-containing protein [Paracidovorax citrulli]
MNASSRRLLCVWLDTALVGRLSEEGNIWRFDYEPAWEGGDLSPAIRRSQGSIIDGASLRPVQWFFSNLLPEEGAKLLLAQDARVDAADNFGLLQFYGRESAGALTLLPEGELLSPAGLQPLTDDALSERIRRLPHVPLSHDAPKRMSLAGAQHKLAVTVLEEGIFEPVGSEPSTHILKPDHPQPDHYWQTTINEWFVMRLASAAGMDAAEVSIRRVPEAVYLVRRFDRTFRTPVERLPVLDACQMLSLDAVFKYREATSAALNALIELCVHKADTRARLYRWWLFNLIAGNSDAHLKNLSFLGGTDGWVLAPHYDLICTSIYSPGNAWGDDVPVTSPEGLPYRQWRRENAVAFGSTIGINARAAERELDYLLQRVQAHVGRLYQEYEDGAARGVDPGEARLLRGIIHGPIKDMTARLA